MTRGDKVDVICFQASDFSASYSDPGFPISCWKARAVSGCQHNLREGAPLGWPQLLD